VPTCSDFTVAMPPVVAGTWSISEQDPGRNSDESSAQCELAFATADQRFAGRLRVFISGESDEDLLRQRVTDERCDGTAESESLPDGYLAFRACSAFAGDFAHATVVAAKDNRWLRMTVSTSIRAENSDAVLPFSRDVVRKAAEQGLTLNGSK
jgi:hypothetical protein